MKWMACRVLPQDLCAASAWLRQHAARIRLDNYELARKEHPVFGEGRNEYPMLGEDHLESPARRALAESLACQDMLTPVPPRPTLLVRARAQLASFQDFLARFDSLLYPVDDARASCSAQRAPDAHRHF